MKGSGSVLLPIKGYNDGLGSGSRAQRMFQTSGRPGKSHCRQAGGHCD